MISTVKGGVETIIGPEVYKLLNVFKSKLIFIIFVRVVGL